MSNQEEISQIMAQAKRAIEEKKAQLGILNLDGKKDELAAKRARVAASLASVQVQNILKNGTNNQVPTAAVAGGEVMGGKATAQNQQKQQAPPLTPQERERVQNLIIDSEGRTVDKRTGEILQIESRVPTLKANLKVAQQSMQKRLEQLKGTLGDKKTDLFASGLASTISGTGILSSATGLKSAISTAGAPTTSSADLSEKFFDPRLKLKTADRNKRKLVFNERGKFEEIANKLRAKAKLTLLQQEIASISRKTGISSESKLALIQPKKLTKETIPNIEWWDFALLNEMNYECLEKLSEDELKEKLKISKLVEHPVQMKPPTHTDKKVIPTVMLTAKERKKMRRQNRAEALKEEQEKIRLGLMAPPEPKVKISNLMRVLGSEAVQDPTKVEEYVRNQMAKRQKMHEEQNASRKLTDAERAAKKKRKIMENTETTGVQVAVYRVRDLNDPAIKFKVEANCNQLHMTGIVLLYKTTNVVIVEGGPKQQRKFKRLMLNRIKWNESVLKKAAAADDPSEGEKEKNSCKLVWEGNIKNRLFGTIIFKSCPTATFVTDYLKKQGCEHYWDIAQSDAILESSDS